MNLWLLAAKGVVNGWVELRVALVEEREFMSLTVFLVLIISTHIK